MLAFTSVGSTLEVKGILNAGKTKIKTNIDAKNINENKLILPNNPLFNKNT